jgi:hypothetical protein
MIVGPGEADRHLDLVLGRASKWADTLLAVADHVDERTEAMLQRELKLGTSEAEGNAVDVWWSNGAAPSFRQDESYVRNALMRLCDKHLDTGDLVVVLDADEELLAPQNGPQAVNLRTVLGDLAALPAEAFSATFYHLWDAAGETYRTDGAWWPAPQFRIYKHDQGARIQQRRMACKAIPESALPRAHTRLRVAHWGYAHEEDRIAKYRRYVRLDGGQYHSLAHIESILAAASREPFVR